MTAAELSSSVDNQVAPSDADVPPARSRTLVWSVVAVVVAESLYALWTASRGYFWEDDFIDLQTLRQVGFSGRLFEQPVFGHFIPGFTFVDYLVSLIVPYPWWLVVAVEIVLFALSLFLLYRLLVTLFGPTWLIVPLVALAGASFSLVPSFVWWATALEYLVAIPATLLALLGHVRYLRTGRLRYAVYGALSIAVGLAFFDGLVVSVVFIVLMTVLVWPAGPGLRGVAQSLSGHWRAWLCYAVPVAAEFGWRLAHPALYLTSSAATSVQALEFTALSWTQTFVPLTLGIDAWLLPAQAERIAIGVLGQVLLVGFVAWTISRRRSAWRAWVLLVVTFVTTAALVGLTRAGTYGPGVASDVKYVALDAFFLIIVVGLALLPLQPPAPGVSPAAGPSDWVGRLSLSSAGAPERTPRPALIRVLIVVAIVAVYGAAMIIDQNRDSESVSSRFSHQYFATFASSWAAVPVAQHAFIWDTEIPSIIIQPGFFPYDTASRTVGVLHPGIHFDRGDGTGYLLRSDGSIVRARAVTQATGILPSPRGACVVTAARAATVVVPLDHKLTGATRWFGVVSYESATGAFATQSDGDTVVFPKGRGTVITGFAPAPMDSVAWTVKPHRSMCITGFRVVRPEPLG